MKISQAFDAYIVSNVICRGLSDKTRESYLATQKLAVDFFADSPIDFIKIDDAQQFLLHLLKWQKRDTARGHLLQLRAVLRFATRRGWTNILADEIVIPKREKREIEYLTKAEVEEFIEVIEDPRRGYATINRARNVAIVEVLWSSGIRVSELCSLNRSSIRDREFVAIGKSKSPRPCFISEEAEEKLRSYLELRTDNSPALFVSNQNDQRITPCGVRRVFRFACDRSDFKGVHPHTLRHSFATYMLSRGVDLRYISAMMGHESLDTTKIYTHYTNPQLRRVYEMAQSR